MYNLKTYAGRLRALSDKHTLLIQTEFNGGKFVNLHTLQEHLWAVKNTEFHCTLQVRKNISFKDFDDGCDSIGFEGVVRDQLFQALFGEDAENETVTEKLEIRAGPVEGGLVWDTQALKACALSHPPYNSDAPIRTSYDLSAGRFERTFDWSGKPC